MKRASKAFLAAMQVNRVIKTPIGVEVESSDEKGCGAEPAKGADAPEIDVLLDGIRRLLAPLRSPISKNERSFVASHICDEIDGLIETFRRASPAEGEVTTGEADSWNVSMLIANLPVEVSAEFDRYFTERGYQYGPSEKDNARGWFKHGADYARKLLQPALESLARERDGLKAAMPLYDQWMALGKPWADSTKLTWPSDGLTDPEHVQFVIEMLRSRDLDIAEFHAHQLPLANILVLMQSENASLRAKLDERDADAERYRYIRALTRGVHGIDVKPVFVLPHIPPMAGANIMRGSVAEHLDVAIDHVRQANRQYRQSAQAASQPSNPET